MTQHIDKDIFCRFNIGEAALVYDVLISDCGVNCSVTLLTRGQGVPDTDHYDNKYICNNTEPCAFSVPALYQHGCQYIMLTSENDVTITFNITSSGKYK